jgi:hypothetical protein
VAQLTDPTEAIPKTPEELHKLMMRAESGDLSTLPVVRRLFQLVPEVDSYGGNLARQAELALIRAIAGKRLSLQEALIRKLELMRAELAGPTPSPVERLLVERVVACWLQANDADLGLVAPEPGRMIVEGEYRHRCCDRAHKRYLSAIKMLALVRKLATPVLQVNIAREQVNMAAAGAVVDGGDSKTTHNSRVMQSAHPRPPQAERHAQEASNQHRNKKRGRGGPGSNGRLSERTCGSAR